MINGFNISGFMVSSVLFGFMVISLFFWWFSRSMSVSLMMVLFFSIFGVMIYSIKSEMKVPLFLVVLTLSGGLFVLVSLVVMFFCEDWKKGVTFAKKIFFSVIISFFVGGLILIGEMSEEELLGGGMKVWGNFVFLYVFLIILLFLFLFVVNLVVNPSTGSMFSKKKMMMVHK